MEIVSTLLEQAGLGLVAGVFLWLYIQERKDHRADNEKNALKIETITESRRLDTVETSKDLTEVLNGNSTAMRILSEKISVGKAEGGS